jgi:hypothetical protein
LLKIPNPWQTFYWNSYTFSAVLTVWPLQHWLLSSVVFANLFCMTSIPEIKYSITHWTHLLAQYLLTKITVLKLDLFNSKRQWKVKVTRLSLIRWLEPDRKNTKKLHSIYILNENIGSSACFGAVVVVIVW